MSAKGKFIYFVMVSHTSGATRHLMDIRANLFGVDVTQSPIGLVQFSISANK